MPRPRIPVPKVKKRQNLKLLLKRRQPLLNLRKLKKLLRQKSHKHQQPRLKKHHRQRQRKLRKHQQQRQRRLKKNKLIMQVPQVQTLRP